MCLPPLRALKYERSAKLQGAVLCRPFAGRGEGVSPREIPGGCRTLFSGLSSHCLRQELSRMQTGNLQLGAAPGSPEGGAGKMSTCKRVLMTSRGLVRVAAVRPERRAEEVWTAMTWAVALPCGRPSTPLLSSATSAQHTPKPASACGHLVLAWDPVNK